MTHEIFNPEASCPVCGADLDLPPPERAKMADFAAVAISSTVEAEIEAEAERLASSVPAAYRETVRKLAIDEQTWKQRLIEKLGQTPTSGSDADA
jgi:hypothetical protein